MIVILICGSAVLTDITSILNKIVKKKNVIFLTSLSSFCLSGIQVDLFLFFYSYRLQYTDSINNWTERSMFHSSKQKSST